MTYPPVTSPGGAVKLMRRGRDDPSMSFIVQQAHVTAFLLGR